MDDERFEIVLSEDNTIEYVMDKKNHNDLDLPDFLELANELDKENERLLKANWRRIELVRRGGFTILRDDRGCYHVYSEHVIPKHSPILSVKAPSVHFNDFIIGYLYPLIERFNEQEFLEDIERRVDLSVD